LKIADFRFHDLRHTAASWLRMKGADIHTVAQLLGHKDLRMASRYQHLSPAFLSDAVNRLDTTFGITQVGDTIVALPAAPTPDNEIAKKKTKKTKKKTSQTLTATAGTS
jgi:hypothetical protein